MRLLGSASRDDLRPLQSQPWLWPVHAVLMSTSIMLLVVALCMSDAGASPLRDLPLRVCSYCRLHAPVDTV